MSENDHLTGRQIAAARTLLGLGQTELASAARISVPTLRRMESSEDEMSGYPNNVEAVRRALETAGVEFTNGDQPGIRMRKDRTYGFVNDDQRLVGLIKNGEFRSDRDGSLIAVVKDGNLHDPQTGEWIAALDHMRATGNPLPDALKDKLK